MFNKLILVITIMLFLSFAVTETVTATEAEPNNVGCARLGALFSLAYVNSLAKTVEGTEIYNGIIQALGSSSGDAFASNVNQFISNVGLLGWNDELLNSVVFYSCANPPYNFLSDINVGKHFKVCNEVESDEINQCVADIVNRLGSQQN